MNEDQSNIRVLIIEDHEVVRKGLRMLLEDASRIEVIADVADGEEAIRIVQEQAPDVVLLDLELATSQIDGIEGLKKIGALSPSTRVVVLSAHVDEAWIFPALHAGVSSYMSKHASEEEVLEAIRDAAIGRYHIDPLIMQKIIQHIPDGYGLSKDSSAEQVLTPREQEILPLLTKGMSNKEIAQRLAISTATVKTHVSNILHKLGATDRNRVNITLAQQQIRLPL